MSAICSVWQVEEGRDISRASVVCWVASLVDMSFLKVWISLGTILNEAFQFRFRNYDDTAIKAANKMRPRYSTFIVWCRSICFMTGEINFHYYLFTFCVQKKNFQHQFWPKMLWKKHFNLIAHISPRADLHESIIEWRLHTEFAPT